MPRKGTKQPYKPKKEYSYSVQDVAELAGMTRNALNVAKAHGKIDPEDFKSVVTFLTRKVIRQRLEGDLFPESKGEVKPKEKAKKTEARKTRTKKAARK